MNYIIRALILISYFGLLVTADVFIIKGVEGVWKTMQPTETIPKNAILGGYSEGGIKKDIYVGRVFYKESGGYLPANVMWVDLGRWEKSSTLQFTYDASWLVRKVEYQLLVEPEDGSHYDWVPASNGTVPDNAVIGGFSKGAEILYVGRVYVNDAIIVGKVSPTYKCIFAPTFMKEYHSNDYEVLVRVPNKHN